MNLVTEKRDGVAVLHVNEERLDAHNSGELKSRMLELLQEGSTRLILDLRDVRFIDSSGLGVLLSGHKNAAMRQGSLALTDLQPQVMSMFELTRLHRVFEIHPGLEEALGDG